MPDTDDGHTTMTSELAARPQAPALLLPTFGAAIFLSAALLFAVQPMFTKMVLPRLGGSPSVWSVAMVFFQTLLLAGYAYAHALTRSFSSRTAVLVQIAVMAVAVLFLPLSIRAGWGRPPETGAALWLISLFAASIGLPFFALSANGPLLQAWFSRTDHPAAHNPYFLYAASNVGSFLALIAYPLVIEPFVPLTGQTWAWSAGFILLIFLIAACGAMLRLAPARATQAIAAEMDATPAPTLRDAARWVALAAIPSGLLVAVTAHISTDVAAVPLLWVVPLALYLLTFVIVFATKPIIPHGLAVTVQPLFVAALVAMLVLDLVSSILWQIAAHLAAFFFAALVCHGELAKRRPAPRHLTAFYMWMAVGGMIGGLSAGLIAPLVFSWVAEYPLLIVLALLCRPGALAIPQRRRERLLWIAAIIAALVILLWMKGSSEPLDDTLKTVAVLAILGTAIVLWTRPLALAVAVAFLLVANLIDNEDATSETRRSFFGVLKISDSADGSYRVLMHGTTIHGAEQIANPGEDEEDEEDDDTAQAEKDKAGETGTAEGGRPTPLTYYFDGSPLAQTIAAAREKSGTVRLAVVGLGAGTLACQTKPGDTLTYYEIDPLVVRIARDPGLFTYLSSCAPNAPIIIGDARLTLADAPDGAYDLIILDAFSSDAIPIHLLTREAIALYARKIAPNGMIVLHLSNRHLELASVVAGVAHANGLVSRLNDDETDGTNDEEYRYASTVAALARKDENLGALTKSTHWQAQTADPAQRVWTDDYSNVVGAILRKLRRR
jgi:hypothetical protein